MGRGAGLAAFAVMLVLGAGTASANVQHPTIAFEGGSITGFEYDEAYTQASFDNIAFDFTECGGHPDETACLWTLNALLAPDHAEFCPSNGEIGSLIWQAGMSANGHVESGPHDFSLRGSEGQMFCLELVKTFMRKGDGDVVVVTGITTRHVLAAVSFGRSALDKMREAIERAGPPSTIDPPATNLVLRWRRCRPVADPYAGTRYEGVDLTHIRARGVACSVARDIARRAHAKALGLPVPPGGVRRFEWHRWSVTGDLRGPSDKYVAKRDDKRVTWVF